MLQKKIAAAIESGKNSITMIYLLSIVMIWKNLGVS